MAEYSVLLPNFVKNFACLGSDCKYTCCRDWAIHWNKTDYKKLLKAKLPKELEARARQAGKAGFSELMGRTVVQVDFAKNSNACPLLDPDGLCAVHRAVGPKALPALCREFPRGYQYVMGTLEAHVRLSCEATVLGLLHLPEGIQFENRIESVHTLMSAHQFYPKDVEKNPLLKYYWEIKTLIIGILQNDYYPLSDRILYVGLVIKRLMALEEAGKLDEVAGMLQGLMKEEDNKEMRKALEKLPQEPYLCMKWMANLCKVEGNQLYATFYMQAMQRIGEVHPETETSTLYTEKYLAVKKDFAEFCEKYPRAMENLAVAILQEDSFPFGGIYGKGSTEIESDRFDLWKNYLFFCLQFSVSQFLLNTLITPESEDKDFAALVGLISRTCIGQYKYFQHVEKMQKMKLDTIEALSILLKG